LGCGSPPIASLQWVLTSKAPLNGAAKPPDVAIQGGVLSLEEGLHGLELIIHMHVEQTDRLCAPLLLEKDARQHSMMRSSVNCSSNSTSSTTADIWQRTCDFVNAQVPIHRVDVEGDSVDTVDFVLNSV